MEDVNKKMAKGAVWMVLFKFADRSLGMVSTIILARLLVPADFGIVAMAMSIIAVLELMTAFGFETALIQKQDAGRELYDTAWTFNVLLAVAAATLLVVLAAPASYFYDEARLHSVVYCLAIGTLVQGFENIGVVAFRKELTFNKEFAYGLVRRVAAFSITVPLAFLLRNYWALVAGMLTARVTVVTVSYLAHPYRPRFCLAARHELFHFSKWLFSSNILSVARTRSADFIIGRFAGSRGLGLWSVAYEISNLPTTELVAPINRAVFPGYSRISNDIPTLRQAYLNVIAMIAMFSLPAGAGIAATAELLVDVVLGAKWVAAIPLIQILAFYGAVTSLHSNVMSAYLALGKPKLLTYLNIAYVSILLPLLLVLTWRAGVMGAAWAYLLAVVIMTPVNFGLIFRTLDLRVGRFLSVMWRPVISAIVMFVSVRLFESRAFIALGDRLQPLQLLATVAFGAGAYMATLAGLWWLSSRPDGAERFLIDTTTARLRFGRSKARRARDDSKAPRPTPRDET